MTKKNIFAAIGASALMLTGTVATPAAAQAYRYYDRSHHDYNGSLSTSYVDSLEWRINNSPMPYGERRALMRELRQIQPLAYRVQTGQASRWEYNRLVAGVNRIENATRYANLDTRYRRYGYNDRRW
jgi:hypothetical protein